MLTDEEIKIIYDEYECEMDAGHTVNGFARAIERAVLKKLEEQEAVFYYRPTSSGGYEGPKWAESMEKCRIDSGVWRPLYAHPLPAQAVPESKPVTYFLATRCGFNDGSGAETLQSGTADWGAANNPQEVFAQMMEVHKTKARDEYKNPNWEKVVATSFSIVSF